MRISDWSSDVCYSDLRVTNRLCCLAQAGKCVRPLWKGHGPFPAGPRRGAKFAPFHKGKWDQAAEIGRASCRERVCQYVSISVVAVSLQTKNEKRYDTNQNTMISKRRQPRDPQT